MLFRSLDVVAGDAEQWDAVELMVYAEIDGVPLLGIAGHDVKAVEYLLGNHVIAEVTEVGLSLDRKVANLLRVIGVDAAEAFGA